MGMPNYTGCSNNYVEWMGDSGRCLVQIAGGEILFVPPEVVAELV